MADWIKNPLKVLFGGVDKLPTGRAIPAGLTPRQVTRADELNDLRDFLYDLRAEVSGLINLRARGAKCDGVTDDTVALLQVLADQGTAPATLIVPGPCWVTSNVAIPPTLPVRYEGGGSFVGGTVTFTPWASAWTSLATSQAVAARVAAEAARDAANAAGKIYATTAAGLAATTDGAYFNVPSGSVNESLLLYKNNSGVAAFVKKYPTTDFVDDPWRRIAGAFFHLPVFEYSTAGGTVYFKPTNYDANSCFFIRGGYYPDAVASWAKVKSDIAAQVPAVDPTYVEVGVTSPGGVADCILFKGSACLWYNPITATFYANARGRRTGDLLMVHANYGRPGKCEEENKMIEARLSSDLATNAAQASSALIGERTGYLMGVMPSGATAPYIPNINTSTNRLEIPNNTLIFWKGSYRDAAVGSISIDLSVVASSAKMVYYNDATSAFVVKTFADVLSPADLLTHHLFAIIRYSPGARVSMAITCRYTVNGSASDTAASATTPDSAGFMATIITPLTGVSTTRSYPNFNKATRTFTIFSDSILHYKNTRWLLAADASIVIPTPSTAHLIYWDTATNTLQSRAWNITNLTAAELTTFVVVAAVRECPTNVVPTVLSIACPYTVDGKLFGQEPAASGSSVVSNDLDAFVRAVAHRGYSTTAPENTLPSYRLAKKMGFSFVECDISWTSDGVPVLLHDDTINRTSTGTGSIGSLTLAQVRAFDFGAWMGGAYTGTLIPTAEEFLRLCFKLSLHPYIELKGSVTEAQVATLIGLVKKTGMRGRVTFISFGYANLQLVKAADPACRLGYIVSLSSASITACAALKTATNEAMIDANYDSVTQPLMEEALAAGVPVEVWTVNGDGSLVPTLAGLGVSGISTDSLNVASILRTAESAI